MARWTKKLIAQQMEWTNECFKKSLIDVYGEHMSEAEKEQDCQDICGMIKLDWREEVQTPETNQLYLKYLCNLDTNKLSLILEAYKLGKQFRNATTMDVIMSELLERSVNPETRHRHES
ncbi:unnamed protein product [Sphagnum balticum]